MHNLRGSAISQSVLKASCAQVAASPHQGLKISDFLEAANRAIDLSRPNEFPPTPGRDFVDTIGHFLRFGPSTIPEAGDGAFLYEGQIEKGGILTFFPGLIYAHSQIASSGSRALDNRESSLFGLGNPYVLHGTFSGERYLVDGRPNGESAQIFAQAIRKAHDAGVPVNHVWLDDNPDLDVPQQDSGPGSGVIGAPTESGGASMGKFMARVAFKEALRQCSLGHKVNRPTEGHEANVAFELVAIPYDLPSDLIQYVPSLKGSMDQGGEYEAPEVKNKDRDGVEEQRLAVVIQAIKDMDTKEDGPIELFMNFEELTQ